MRRFSDLDRLPSTIGIFRDNQCRCRVLKVCTSPGDCLDSLAEAEVASPPHPLMQDRRSTGTRCPLCGSRRIETTVRGDLAWFTCLACDAEFPERRHAPKPARRTEAQSIGPEWRYPGVASTKRN